MALIQATAHLATAPKSNTVYACSDKVREAITRHGSLPISLHLRNAPIALKKDFRYGHSYQYAHNDRDALVFQETSRFNWRQHVLRANQSRF
jgi:putative ATPase